MIEKVRENKLRRQASRRGLTLRRSPRRDTKALDYARYAITNGNGLMHQDGPISIYSLTMREVESYLNQ